MTEHVIALAGNPNVGKSTVFNALTGMKQHTGNWAGKTVTNAKGSFSFNGENFVLVDTPGAYSLRTGSAEETAARNFLLFGGAEAAVIVCDATCLERSLNLAIQVIEASQKALVCVNLMDEATSKGISVNIDMLSQLLGVPVIGTSARNGKGLDELIAAISSLVNDPSPAVRRYIKLSDNIENAVSQIIPLIEGKIHSLPLRTAALHILEGDMDFINRLADNEHINIKEIADISADNSISREQINSERISAGLKRSSEIAAESVTFASPEPHRRDRKIDRILLNPVTGIPVMLLLFALVLWITMIGANYPSDLLYSLFSRFGDILEKIMNNISAPDWLTGVLIHGIYQTSMWVVAVMLPPMAIFFPMFTLLEDFGYLPRIAFNLDGCFRRSGACGKQAITMAMGLGCNACGVTGCRIIDSPRERLIAVITNSLIPCNGRFPTLIALITMFFAISSAGFISGLVLPLLLIASVCVVLLTSRLLSKTLLRGAPSAYTLELPPYRRPQIGKMLVRSLLDRTIFVLGRACATAAPCGLIIWILANVRVGESTILAHAAELLQPIGNIMGLDGVILLAFILGFPANEIVMPIILMSYLAQGTLADTGDLSALKTLLIAHGWNIQTAICMTIFTLFHFPCATTCLTIRRETGSLKWTAISFALPTFIGFILCCMANLLMSIFA